MGFYESSTFEPERSIGYLMRVINTVALAQLEPGLASEGLSNTQWQVLVSIYFNRGLTCAALARDLSHDKGAMTRLLDGLEERGLVGRERNVDDRRVVDVVLTPAGRDAAERGKTQVLACWNAWLADWAPTEVETLIAQLQRLRTTIALGPGNCA